MTAAATARAGGSATNRRALAVAAALGFLLGSFTTAALVWRYGNFIGARDPRAPAAHAPATRRWLDTPGDQSVSRAAVEETTGHVVPEPPPSPRRPTDNLTEAGVLADLAGRNLQMPVEGVKRNALVRSFDEARGGDRRHEAIDILAPRHTRVVAVEDGTIARLFRSGGGGLTIYQFDPAGRIVYYYAHLERYAGGLREGDAVRRGQVIGYVGTSGNAPPDTPHLHFAIFRLTGEKRWWEGMPVDPYEVLIGDQ